MQETRGQEEERGKIPSFKTIALTSLFQELTQCNEAFKFVFVADMSGKVVTACEYGNNTSVNDFQAEVKKQIIQKTQTKEQVSEKLRKSFVFNMIAGKSLVINCDSMVPSFADDYDCKNCPLRDILFDQTKMYDKQAYNYKTILKPGEDKDDQGNANMYYMKDTFQVVIVANMSDPDTDDEIIQMLLDQIPHADKFQKYYVNE